MHIRVTPEEKEILREMGEKFGLPMSRIVRAGADHVIDEYRKHGTFMGTKSYFGD